MGVSGLEGAHGMAGDASGMGGASVLPEVDPLPGAQEQASFIDAETEGLTGQCRADVGRHVVKTLIVVAITVAMACGGHGAAAILGDNRIHPALQVLKHSGIGVFVNGQAGARVQTGQMQHSPLQSRASQPGVQSFIESGEAAAWCGDLQLFETLIEGHWPGVGWALQF